MLINTKFDLGDIVFLKTDPDQLERMVTAFKIYPPGIISYNLSCGTVDSDHYDIEISAKKDLLKELNIPSDNACK